MAIEDIYPEEQIINSLVGPGSKFKGDLEVHGLVRVDGDYVGSINSSGKILIGQGGRFEGTLNARIVVVGGIIRGNIYAKHRVILLRGCIVLGNIYVPRLVIEELSQFDGYLHVNGHELSRTEPQSQARASQRFRAREILSNLVSGQARRESASTAADSNRAADKATEPNAKPASTSGGGALVQNQMPSQSSAGPASDGYPGNHPGRNKKKDSL